MTDQASYTKRQDGDATVFETVPAPCPKYWLALVLGVLIAVVAVASGATGLVALIMWGLALLAIVAFFRDPRPSGFRAPARLRVNASEIVTTSGLNFSGEDIGSLQLDNIYDESGSGAGINIAGLGGDLGPKRKEDLRAVSWLLRLNPANGTPAINIACGMDHDTATNLLREFDEILGDRRLR